MQLPGKDKASPLGKSPGWPRAIGLAIIAISLLALHTVARGQQSAATEDQVKAAYLLNFAKLAEWPRSALPEGPSALVIGISGGGEDFLAAVKAVVAGKIAGTHPLQVKAVNSTEEMKSCQIVFFGASEKRRIQAAIEGIAQTGVLLVGEDDSFLRQGGMINLVRDHGTIHFEVNSEALDRSEIRFSAKILALAKSGSGSAHSAVSTSSDEESRTDAARQEGGRRVEHRVPPEYPEIAERMKLAGTVQVEALVRPDGTVREVRVVGGHPLLVDALVRAVRQWKYQAAPKETVETVKFTFVPQ
ncbi:MAG TPA: TonB family protein [Terriglobales bacterium]|jgi:TonB family protein|nr:TonB family protein [Terriglobales bacterium]